MVIRDPPKVVDLPQADSVRAKLEELKRVVPILLEFADVTAKIRRANYESLLKEGFTEAQALDLCWR